MLKIMIVKILVVVSNFLFCDCGSPSESVDMRPERLIADSSSRHEFANLDYEKHICDLKEKIPKGFTVILEKPFVVIGDESPEMVGLRSKKTIRWAVDMLKQDYFERDPDEIIDIWLFKDEASYYKHAKKIFGDDPTTPFGYYSEEHKALIMNINTGGGTLVHEIVHPFIRANFRGCPAWFNEGLASLYEQCGSKNGHIYGYTNWRLKGLQEAIRRGSVLSFKELTSLTEHEFYLEDKGTNYGQARYLCYYLQEKGLLVKYYHQFYKNRKRDSTGYETLRTVLDEKNMDIFKVKWEQFVLMLTYP
jgi:hypothetical protein